MDNDCGRWVLEMMGRPGEAHARLVALRRHRCPRDARPQAHSRPAGGLSARPRAGEPRRGTGARRGFLTLGRRDEVQAHNLDRRVETVSVLPSVDRVKSVDKVGDHLRVDRTIIQRHFDRMFLVLVAALHERRQLDAFGGESPRRGLLVPGASRRLPRSTRPVPRRRLDSREQRPISTRRVTRESRRNRRSSCPRLEKTVWREGHLRFSGRRGSRPSQSRPRHAGVAAERDEGGDPADRNHVSIEDEPQRVDHLVVGDSHDTAPAASIVLILSSPARCGQGPPPPRPSGPRFLGAPKEQSLFMRPSAQSASVFFALDAAAASGRWVWQRRSPNAVQHAPSPKSSTQATGSRCSSPTP